MLIFGHNLIPSECFAPVSSIPEIAKTKPNQTILLDSLESNIDTIKYCQDHDISYAVNSNTIKDSIFANALGATYILVESKQAKMVQDIATEYLFDSKVLAYIEDDSQIEDMALLGIDGVLFAPALAH